MSGALFCCYSKCHLGTYEGDIQMIHTLLMRIIMAAIPERSCHTQFIEKWQIQPPRCIADWAEHTPPLTCARPGHQSPLPVGRGRLYLPTIDVADQPRSFESLRARVFASRHGRTSCRSVGVQCRGVWQYALALSIPRLEPGVPRVRRRLRDKTWAYCHTPLHL